LSYELVELLRKRVFGMALGYTTQDDADRLAHDPAMKLAAWNATGPAPLDERLASQPTQSQLLDILAHDSSNRAALRDSLIVHLAQVVQPFWQQLVAAVRRWRLPSRFDTPRGPTRRAWMPLPRHAFASEVRRL
jgi:hypothetical protein